MKKPTVRNLWRAAALLACAMTAGAHPMGNFSVNHYSRIQPQAQGVELIYVLDLAEIPTFELLQKWSLTGESPHAEIERQARVQAHEWMRQLVITVNGRSVEPHLQSTEVSLADGAGGMRVMRVNMRLRLPVAAGKLEYEDRNYPERAGWKEIVRNVSIQLGEGITGAAAAQREPILVPDVRSDRRYLNALDAVRSELAVPMLARNMLVGVIDVQSTSEKAYTEYDRALLRLIASRVASSIDNARLYRRVERQNRTLRTLSRISHEFASIL